ncbi:hypothetical protein CBOM_07989 [Ceraceosorus bombacis]|uniref:Uncharacterized protein n=1 Tax=Ceraceosorus bombacis TaxID=401625 RepID=A0A0P1BJP8_9BASI|nr:hypothetical protein CBOM_07989 [Ceraceosorus bombacis]
MHPPRVDLRLRACTHSQVFRRAPLCVMSIGLTDVYFLPSQARCTSSAAFDVATSIVEHPRAQRTRHSQ